MGGAAFNSELRKQQRQEIRAEINRQEALSAPAQNYVFPKEELKLPKGEKFIMNIDGKAVMERKTAGSIIISDAKGYFRPGTEAVTEAKAGQFAGFDLYITTDNRAVLKGSGTYSVTINMESPLGTIQALEGAVRKLDTIASNLENSILENKRSIPKFEKAAEAEFDKKDELMKLRLRAAEIAEELNPEENAAAGLEEEPEDSINRFIDTGGKRNGRKVDNSRDRRRMLLEENAGKQVAEGSGKRPLDDREGNGGGSEQRGSREGIRSTDSEGQRISGEAAKKLKGTAVTDSNGRPLAVYHATNKVFDKFTIGDVGFHFGNYKQAEERARYKKFENPIYIRAYLNIKNPAVVKRDPNGWHPLAAALTLWNEDYITFEE